MLDFGIISEINSSFLCVVGDACNGTVVAEKFITILATGESILDEVICVLHVNVDISTGGVCEFIDNIRCAIVFHNHETCNLIDIITCLDLVVVGTTFDFSIF